MSTLRHLFCACAIVALAACDQSPFPDLDLERMIHQKKYLPYASSEFFADGKAMRSPPAGAVAHDRPMVDPARSTGMMDGRYVEPIPMEVSKAMMDRGHERFDIFCAPCHGIAGDGESMVAANMQLRRPPSLVNTEVRSFPAGKIFQIVSEGYGFMRPYSDALSIDDRWAVIWYVRALQLRSGVSLDRLPLALQSRAKAELP
jgi:Cytochrome C oxidase, cbb3-type, subunit III